jgi:uncharacterized protein (TIGR02145 family)
MKKITKIVMAGLLIFSSAVCVAQTAAMTPDITVEINTPYTITSAVNATGATAYRWLENGIIITNGSSVSYTNSAGKPNNSSYIYIRQAWINNCWQNSNAIIVQIGTGGTISGSGCDFPGTTVDFIGFNPCNVAVGSTWTLVDYRESGNNQSYKVKKMPDGHIWMVQELKFGTCLNSTANWVAESSEAATTQGTTVAPGYIGHCRASSQPLAGYYYTWAAAMQNSLAYYGSNNKAFTCSGTLTGSGAGNPSACRGICPMGWHIPTGGNNSEINTLLVTVAESCNATSELCTTRAALWEPHPGGYVTSDGNLNEGESYVDMWSSSFDLNAFAWALRFRWSDDTIIRANSVKNNGLYVRCVMNY